MTMTTKLSLVSVLALLIAAPAAAQQPAHEGDYYVPTQATPQVLTPAQLRITQDGDYYVADKMVLHHHRIAAITTCTDGVKFASDSYITCMLKGGENP